MRATSVAVPTLFNARDMYRGVVVGRHARNVVAADVAQAEGLRHRERAVSELRSRRDEFERDAFLGEFAECHARLQPSDASAGDHDLHRSALHPLMVAHCNTSEKGRAPAWGRALGLTSEFNRDRARRLGECLRLPPTGRCGSGWRS